jgi:hypothetical protein
VGRYSGKGLAGVVWPASDEDEGRLRRGRRVHTPYVLGSHKRLFLHCQLTDKEFAAWCTAILHLINLVPFE